MDFSEKLARIGVIFGQSTPLQDGNYYGGMYNGRKLMYSEILIQTLSIEKLEAFIKKQLYTHEENPS